MSHEVRHSPRARRSWTGHLPAPAAAATTSIRSAAFDQARPKPGRDDDAPLADSTWKRQPSDRARPVKRAKSLAGGELQNLDPKSTMSASAAAAAKRNATQSMLPPSRRNVIFASPSTLQPSPTAQKLRGRQSLAPQAPSLVTTAPPPTEEPQPPPPPSPKPPRQQPEPLPRGQQSHQPTSSTHERGAVARASSSQVPHVPPPPTLARSNSESDRLLGQRQPPQPLRPTTQSSSQTQVIHPFTTTSALRQAGVGENATVGAERKRRVTFGHQIATTKFGPEEPTLHIRPVSNVPMPDMTGSSASTTDGGVDTDDSETDSEEESREVDMELATSSSLGWPADSSSSGSISRSSHTGGGGAEFDGSGTPEDSAQAVSWSRGDQDPSSMDLDDSAMDISQGNAAAEHDPSGGVSGTLEARSGQVGEESTATTTTDTSLDDEDGSTNGRYVAPDDRTQTMQFTQAFGAIYPGDDGVDGPRINGGGWEGQRESVVIDKDGDEVSSMLDVDDEDDVDDDETQDLGEQSGMEFTQALGDIKHVRRSLGGRRSTTGADDDRSVAMEMTEVVGGDRGRSGAAVEEEQSDDEESSMELTNDVSRGGPRTSDASTMQMTRALGRLLSPQRPTSTTPSPSKAGRATPNRDAKVAAMAAGASASSASPRLGHEHCHKPASQSPQAKRTASPTKAAPSSPSARPAKRSGAPTPSPKKQPPSPSKSNVASHAAASAVPASRVPYPSSPRAPPSASPSKAGGNATPSRFRQRLLGGVASPGVRHTPPARVATAPVEARLRTASGAESGLSKRRAEAPPPQPSRANSSSPTRSSRPTVRGPPAAAAAAAKAVVRKSLGGAVPTTSRLDHMLRPGASFKAARRRASTAGAASSAEAFASGVGQDGSGDTSRSSTARATSAPSSGGGGAGGGGNSSALDAGALAMVEGPSAPSSGEEEEERRLTTTDFFSLVGVEWHDGMVPSRRTLDVPAHLLGGVGGGAGGGRRHRKDGNSVEAMRHVKAASGALPMLERLIEACREMQTTLHDTHERLVRVEDDFYNNPPLFVSETLTLDDKGRKDVEIQFGLQKSAARASALQDYYGWRADKQFDDAAVAELRENRARLQRLVDFVDHHGPRVREDVVASLRERHAALAEELRGEKQRKALIAGADPAQLRDLHEGIDEQGQMLQEMLAKKLGVRQRLLSLQERIDEAAQKRRGIEADIAVARSIYEQIKGCTRGEAARLLRETRNLEALHQWTLESVSTTTLSLVHAQSVSVALELDAADGRVRRATLGLVQPTLRDSVLAGWAMEAMRSKLPRGESGGRMAVTEVVRRVTTAWARLRQVALLFESLAAHFPAQMRRLSDASDRTSASPGLHALEVQADVVLVGAPQLRSKAVVRVRLDGAVLISQRALESLPAPSAVLAYGEADPIWLQKQLDKAWRSQPAPPSLVNACLRLADAVAPPA